MAHLFIVVVYDSFNRKNVKISTTYYFPDFSFFMSQDDAHYQNHRNAPLWRICKEEEKEHEAKFNSKNEKTRAESAFHKHLVTTLGRRDPEILKAYRKPFTRLMEKGTYISSQGDQNNISMKT